MRIRLVEHFRYVHEPVLPDDPVIPSLGHDELVEALTQRILHSRGGAFLVTGFRGAGKTTVVSRAIAEVTKRADGGVAILPVLLSVARPVPTNELLFAVVRRIFEELSKEKLFELLAPSVREALLIAYRRTSLTVKETRAATAERGFSVSVGGGTSRSAGVMGMIAPKADLTGKRSRSLSTETSFLTYSESDVEYDVLRIIELLGAPLAMQARWWRRSIRRLLRRRPALIRIQPIVVLDEVDKFTAADNGLAELERLVSSLKNVLTTRGVHFVVVAGVDLHDQVVRDAYRGNSVYESVFGWQLYVPCLWESPDDLTDGVVLEAHDYPVELDDLVGYLGFKARGVPRRLLQEFNGFVQWVDGSPVLELDDHDSDRIRFYARIDELIREFLHRPGDAVLFPVPLDEDRWRLSTYYAVDRVLRTEGKTFTINEILRIEGELEFDPVLRVSTALANRLLTYLTEHSLIEVVQRADDASAVHVGDVKEAQFTVYRLVDDVKRALFGFALESESERATFGEPVLTSPDVTADVPAIEILADRYVLRDVIGRGGFGTVYGGLDMLLGQPVAVKILGSTMTDDPTARARFLREGRIAAKLVHANIVRTHDLLELDDGRIAIVMELVSGETLRELVRPDGIPGDKAIEVALDLLSALAECDRQKIARIDLKPSNIIIADGRTVIVDLGLARAHGADLEVTKEGVLIGTPLYMAPEQANGERADIRTDLYAVALVLYECLAGRPARREGSQMEVIMEIINKDLDVGDLPASPELKAVIARAAARNPKDRYSTPEQMSQALQAMPEYARSEPS